MSIGIAECPQVSAASGFADWLELHTTMDCDIGITARAVRESCGEGVNSPAALRRCFRLALARWDGAGEIDLLGIGTAAFDNAVTEWRAHAA